jgi:hypothetical protein
MRITLSTGAVFESMTDQATKGITVDGLGPRGGEMGAISLAKNQVSQVAQACDQAVQKLKQNSNWLWSLSRGTTPTVVVPGLIHDLNNPAIILRANGRSGEFFYYSPRGKGYRFGGLIEADFEQIGLLLDLNSR